MFEQELIMYAAPTLAGLKTGSMFSVKCPGWSHIRKIVRGYNNILVPGGLTAIPLRFKEGRVLLYIYRPGRLEKDLETPEIRCILEKLGYKCEHAGKCLALLAFRIKKEANFPHEIGLFLGYPPEDVKGFMDSPSCGYICNGCWKVYGDREASEEKFRRYRSSTDIYMKMYKMGYPIHNLIVSDQRDHGRQR